MKITIRNFILGIYVWTFIGFGIVENIPMLSVVKFLPDVIIMGLLLYKHIFVREEFYNPFSRIVLYVLFFETLVSYCIHYENAFYYLWGLRNLFRYFLYMHICICFLKKEDFFLLCKITLFFLFVNTPIMFYQGVILNLFGDNVGGLLGTSTGVNAYTNIHLVLSTVIVISLYSKSKLNVFSVSMVLLCCFLQAALAELKFYYIEFVIVFIWMFLFSKDKRKLLPIVNICYGIFLIGFVLMSFFYEENGAFFTLDSMMEYSDEAYAKHCEGIDRTTALPLIKMFFLTNFFDYLFGIGLGNAEFTSLYTPIFISNYGYFHLYFFSHAMIFLEIGLIGLILYVLFFLDYFILNFSRRDSIQTFVGVSLIPLVFCLCIYNQSLRMDSAFLIFTFLALPYT